MSRKEWDRGLRNLCRATYNRSIHLTDRSSEPYATHIPVLVGVAAVIKPRVLIEFGCGTFSTFSFLDNAAFPWLETVDSYENNEGWFQQVGRGLPEDSPIRLHLVQGEMHRAIGGAGTSGASMIFIDDSPTAEERVPTIREVARCCGTEPVVVLHDYDLWRLRLAARKFQHRLSIDAFNPQCGVLWNGHPERHQALELMNDVIRRFAHKVPVTDIRRWREVFLAEGY